MFLNYPLIYFPDPIEKYLGKAASDVNSPKKIASPPINYQPTKPPQQPIYLLPIAKKVRVVGWVFSGLVGINLLSSLLYGAAWSFLLPAIFVLVIKTLLVTGLVYYAQKFDRQQQQDYKEQQERYWKKNKQLNQNITRQTFLHVKQEFRAANPQLRIRRNNSLQQHSLIRGVYQEDAQKGVSESYFFKYLQKYFYDCEITCDYFVLNSEIGYTTDFSLIFSQKYGIDIEIDEPYAGKTKQPHHCQDDPRDRNRNAYFLVRGWIVVRFSEHQAVFYPESCCREIAKIIEGLGESKYLSVLESLDELPPDRTWTHSSATAMAARKYRELYLDQAGLFTYNAEREQRNAKKQSKSPRKPRRRKPGSQSDI